jgi:hypothetical protein
MIGVETLACVPEHMHWFSQAILDYYVSGRITTGEFLRWFHMPNSSYLAAGECVVAHLDPGHDPLRFSPGILDGYVR